MIACVISFDLKRMVAENKDWFYWYNLDSYHCVNYFGCKNFAH